MSILTKLFLFNVVLWGYIIISTWYRKNREKVKAGIAEKKLEKGKPTLKLYSEAIEAFLDSHDSEEIDKDAWEFLSSIRSMFRNNVWTISALEASFKTKNRTEERLAAVKATCDLYIEDRLFYTLDFVRASVPAGGEINVKENIAQSYASAKSEIKMPKEPLMKRSAPRTEGKFRDYEVQIDESHYLFTNHAIREIAGEGPVITKQDYYDLFKELSETLEDESLEYANSIISSMEKALQYSENNDNAREKVDAFIKKYMPTLVDSISSSSLENTDESTKSLNRTLRIMSISTKNFYSKLIETDIDKTDVDRTVLEQQVIRDGLYNPYEEE